MQRGTEPRGNADPGRNAHGEGKVVGWLVGRGDLLIWNGRKERKFSVPVVRILIPAWRQRGLQLCRGMCWMRDRTREFIRDGTARARCIQ
jgi:hypothetical protein